MGRPLRITYAGAHYHVTSRGSEQKDIFKSRRDREKFLSYLESSVTRYGAAIHAYCLMTNHYHLLLETPVGNLPEIMRHINGAYTNYYNTKRKRSGHLFQGRYKAILIEADEYLMELSRYIHLNPVRCGIVEKPEAHPWSSYNDYIGARPAPGWLRMDMLSAHFGDCKKHRQFVEFRILPVVAFFRAHGMLIVVQIICVFPVSTCSLRAQAVRIHRRVHRPRMNV
ncbi:MAG: transposase, partial [Geobacteraceae bacterium]